MSARRLLRSVTIGALVSPGGGEDAEVTHGTRVG
jgi:hypothetical protein